MEGRPGEARAALRRSVIENGFVLLLMLVLCIFLYHLLCNFSLVFLLLILHVLHHNSQFFYSNGVHSFSIGTL